MKLRLDVFMIMSIIDSAARVIVIYFLGAMIDYMGLEIGTITLNIFRIILLIWVFNPIIDEILTGVMINKEVKEEEKEENVD